MPRQRGQRSQIRLVDPVKEDRGCTRDVFATVLPGSDDVERAAIDVTIMLGEPRSSLAESLWPPGRNIPGGDPWERA